MMIAAAHLMRGDVPATLPLSDEDGFDDRYRSPHAPDRILSNSARSGATSQVRRVITFHSGGYRCWNNTTLIEIEARS